MRTRIRAFMWSLVLVAAGGGACLGAGKEAVKDAPLIKEHRWAEARDYYAQKLIEFAEAEGPKSEAQLSYLALCFDVAHYFRQMAREQADSLPDWLLSEPDFTAALLRAFTPYNEPPNAFRVLDGLKRRSGEQTVLKFRGLAIAHAIVWDKGKAGSPKADPAAYFDYFVSNARKITSFDLARLPYQPCLFLASTNVTIDELTWALKIYNPPTNMGAIYNAPVYDLDSIFYSAKKITGHDYTLQNILKYGGVCVDRAHFSANVARACGIPAVTLGHGKESGLGHAWTGYIQPGGKTGRNVYNWDLTVGGGDYATFGKTRDPRTGKRLHDYELPMITAECGERPETVRTSSAYTTLARALVETGKFAPATQALEQAIKRNKFNLTAWTMIGQLFKEASFTEGSFDAGYADRIMDETLKMFPDTPDFCYGAFTTLMGMIPREEYARRVRLYKQAVGLFKSRPNLTVAVGRDYGDYLLEADKKREAYQIYFNTITALMEKPEFAADVAIKFVDTQLEGDEPQRAVTLLQSVLKRTKKPKYNDPFARFSPWYRLQTSLRDVYASAGRKKESDAVEAELSHYSMRDK